MRNESSSIPLLEVTEEAEFIRTMGLVLAPGSILFWLGSAKVTLEFLFEVSEALDRDNFKPPDAFECEKD